MREGKKQGILWRLLDGSLVVVIFLLLGYSAVKGSNEPSIKSQKVTVEKRESGKKEKKKSGEELPAKQSNRVVRGIRVSNGFSTGRTMERMATDDWSDVRTAPAMDMRENGKSFEVVFTVSEDMDLESIRAVTEGNVLKLSMKNKSGKKLTKKVLIPWYESLEGANLQSQVTNGILRVRIEP